MLRAASSVTLQPVVHASPWQYSIDDSAEEYPAASPPIFLALEPPHRDLAEGRGACVQ